jgi:hypothetical protein
MNEVRDEAHKSPERLEREIDETRADISDTVDALARKFSPGELLDRSLGVVKEHGGEVAVNLRDSIKQNPLAALLTGVGLVWLMTSSSRDRSEYWTGDADYAGSDYAGSGDWSSDGESKLSRARQRLSETGEQLKGAVTGARERLTGARERLAGARERFGGAASSVGERLGHTRDSARERAYRTRAGFNNLREQEPLILGAIGIAVGALIGAALPRSETENRLIGDASDSLKGELKTKARDVYGQARETAEKATEAASQAISKENQPAPHC